MASLGKLPTEILGLILQYTPLVAQRKLLYTCRQFCDLVKPNIYRHIKINLTPEDRNNRNTVIVLLHRTLQNNHTLAFHVRKLDIQGSKPLALLIEFSDNELREWLYKTDCRSGTYSRWKHQLLKGDTDAIIATVIASLKNLRVLRLGHDLWSDSKYLSSVLPRLEQLQEVEFCSIPSYGGDSWDATEIFKTVDGPIAYDMTQLQNLLDLPRIKSITCLAAEPRGGETFTMPSTRRPLCNSLVRLCFQNSELKQSTLARVLAATPRLRELQYDHWIDAHSSGGMTQYFECDLMDAALEPVRETLQSLRIGITFFTHYAIDIGWGYDWGVKGTMVSLAGFPQLTYIEIPLVVLVGWNPKNSNIQLGTVLPRSLRFLKFIRSGLHYFEYNEWNGETTYNRIRDYVNGAHSHAPELEQIELHLYQEDTDEAISEYSLLRNACIEANISLEICRTEL